MGASFRNVGEIEALAGCDRAHDLARAPRRSSKDEGALPRRSSRQAARQRAARMSLDEPLFRWALNEDAMATEKLAEGIRLFAADLGALRQEVAKRLEG